MYYVYLLHSIDLPEKKYVGFTKDLKKRVQAHNAGQSIHTKQNKPWKLVTYIAFENEPRARAFERYLKSHSGMAFASKRLW